MEQISALEVTSTIKKLGDDQVIVRSGEPHTLGTVNLSSVYLSFISLLQYLILIVYSLT